MHTSLKDLTYIDDFSFLKIILSSADRFPGLYRFTSAWRNDLENPGFMKLMSYLEACHWTNKGKKWSKNEWFSIHEKIFDLSFGSMGRNEVRKDQEIGSFLKEKSVKWLETPSSFSLAVLDYNFPVESIEPGQTYYMMGSLIKFYEDKVLVSQDDFNKTCYVELKISYEDTIRYIEKVFSPRSMSELFFKSEIVGQLDFDENLIGNLRFDSSSSDRFLFQYNSNSLIFASPNYSHPLPIRYAKLIGVSHVCR